MRKALNENPLVQMALLGLAAVTLAAILLMRMGGGTSADSAPAMTDAPGAAVAPAVASESAVLPAPDTDLGGSGTATGPGEAGIGAVDPSETKGLPAAYVKAAASGRPIAIFVVRGKPVSDKLISGYARKLEAERGAAVFVIHPRQLADWVRVVGSVGVDRTPALVVVTPAKGSGAPTAEVSYGFRNYESVRQAVADARYDGPTRGYDPG